MSVKRKCDEVKVLKFRQKYTSLQVKVKYFSFTSLRVKLNKSYFGTVTRYFYCVTTQHWLLKCCHCFCIQYRQNPELRRELFATANSVLVEASKDDCRWGIGSTKDDPQSWRRQTWRGYNWLGNILTETRDTLMTEVCSCSADLVRKICSVLFYVHKRDNYAAFFAQLYKLLKMLSVGVSVCLSVWILHSEICNVAYTDLLMNPDHTPKTRSV